MTNGLYQLSYLTTLVNQVPFCSDYKTFLAVCSTLWHAHRLNFFYRVNETMQHIQVIDENFYNDNWFHVCIQWMTDGFIGTMSIITATGGRYHGVLLNNKDGEYC